MRFWFSRDKKIQDSQEKRLSNLRDELRRFPRPFRVEYFVDHLIVLDANHSECYRMADEVALALNLVAESEDSSPIQATESDAARKDK